MITPARQPLHAVCFLGGGNFDGMHRLRGIDAEGGQRPGCDRRRALRDRRGGDARMRKPAAETAKRDEKHAGGGKLEPVAWRRAAVHGKIGNAQARRDGLPGLELQALAQRVSRGDIRRHAVAELWGIAKKAADKRVTVGAETPANERIEIVFADRRVGNHFTLRNCGADPVSIAWRKRSRARLKRDMTVPMGISRVLAISA